MIYRLGRGQHFVLRSPVKQLDPLTQVVDLSGCLAQARRFLAIVVRARGSYLHHTSPVSCGTLTPCVTLAQSQSFTVAAMLAV
jgi:hypothetical protein